jgi:PhzF family phenazine biosynthesis protein
MRQWTVDAFASQPFRGNPACVVEPFDAWPDAGWMQSLAAENNQAETAFLLRTADPDRFGLRWFTPAVEVPLCGHATLGSGHVLLAELGVQAASLTFDTPSGPLRVERHERGYQMDFPASPSTPIDPPAGLAAALGAEPVEVFSAPYLAIRLANEATVRSLAPDSAALMRISLAAAGGRGDFGVFALAEPGRPYDIVSRFFAPGAGIAEDPATGSWHCIISPIASKILGRPVIRYYQAYPGRGGELECEHRGERVLIRGAAVTVAESTLRL